MNEVTRRAWVSVFTLCELKQVLNSQLPSASCRQFSRFYSMHMHTYIHIYIHTYIHVVIMSNDLYVTRTTKGRLPMLGGTTSTFRLQCARYCGVRT